MSANTEHIFKYGDFEGVYKSTNYVQVEALENALEQLITDTQTASQAERESAKIKGMVLAIAAVFDNVFGEDAANKVLGDSTDLNDAFDALMALIDFSNTQDLQAAERWKSVVSKYAPNRAARRATGKAGKK